MSRTHYSTLLYSFDTLELAAESVRFIANELNLLPETSGCFLDGQRLANMEGGLAVVPASSQIGDLVYFLGGSSVPLVFRDTLGPEAKYDFRGKSCRDFHLIGECILVPGTGSVRKWMYPERIMEWIAENNSPVTHDITIH